MTPPVMRLLILALCSFLFFQACVDMRSARPSASPDLAGAANERPLIKGLIDNGGRVNARNDDGQTPLHCVVAFPKWKGNFETAVLLLKKDALTQVRDILGPTPLDLAKAGRKMELMRLRQ